MNIALILIVAYVVAKAQHEISRPNIGARWNGFGALHDTYVKKSLSPMIYRILVPYLWSWTRNVVKNDAERYGAIRFLLVVYMLLSVYIAVGFWSTIIFSILLIATFWFDYWDYAPEVAGVALCMTGDPWLAAIGIVLWGLSRETVLIAGPAFFLVAGDYYSSALLACLSLFTFLAVRKIQGHKPLYCERWMIRRNWELLFRPKYPGLFNAVWVTIATCVLSLAGAIIVGEPVGLIVPVFIVAGLTMAKIDETRVLAPCLIWVALLLEKML